MTRRRKRVPVAPVADATTGLPKSARLHDRESAAVVAARCMGELEMRGRDMPVRGKRDGAPPVVVAASGRFQNPVLETAARFSSEPLVLII